ncbi:cytochrome P450 [Ceratobasidium sp. AG-I]|nr:cytochrome P450 [Ceratobasidium sp. AG-I]
MASWTWGSVALSITLAWIVNRWMRYQKELSRVHRIPGMRLLFDPYSLIGFLSPPVKGIFLGSTFQWDMKDSLFQKLGSEIYSLVGILNGTPGYHISDPNIIKQIVAPRSAFTKRTEDYASLRGFGDNLLTTEGEQWKRQRRICAPAFSDRNNRLAWKTATEFTDEIMSTWSDNESTKIPDFCHDISLPFDLCVIAKAGFGQDFKWHHDDLPQPGRQFTFKGALFVVAPNVLLPLVLPNWAWGLRKQWRDYKQAYDELMAFFNEIIASRRDQSGASVQTAQKDDILSQLLEAHDSDEKLTTTELIGNIFIFMIAGHETTANTLGFLLGLLALYPDIQDKLVRHIKEVQPKDREFTYDDLHKLTYVIAVLYETLRLYPSVLTIHKHASTDAELKVSLKPGTTEVISIPASTRVGIHVPGLHYNPKYWDDPEEFIPERFLDPKWNRDAFIPFAVGPRSCIGRRFAETTVAAFLVHVLSKYRISIDESKFKSVPGESTLDRRARFLRPGIALSLAPPKLSLVFTPLA